MAAAMRTDFVAGGLSSRRGGATLPERACSFAPAAPTQRHPSAGGTLRRMSRIRPATSAWVAAVQFISFGPSEADVAGDQAASGRLVAVSPPMSGCLIQLRRCPGHDLMAPRPGWFPVWQPRDRGREPSLADARSQAAGAAERSRCCRWWSHGLLWYAEKAWLIISTRLPLRGGGRRARSVACCGLVTGAFAAGAAPPLQAPGRPHASFPPTAGGKYQQSRFFDVTGAIASQFRDRRMPYPVPWRAGWG